MTTAFDTISDRIKDLPESTIIEVVDMARDDPGVYPLWVGESDLPTPDFIVSAATRALADGHTRYTYSRGIPSLREALAEYHSRLYGTEIGVERISITVGGMQAVMQAFQALINPDDEVIIPSPTWPNIVAAAQIVGAQVKSVPLRLTDHGWRLDIDELLAAVTPRTKIIAINSPSNPTGWIMPREDMAQVLAFARQHGLWILADEVYIRLTYEVDHAPSFLELCEPEDRLIVANTFSKCWAMTGWRIGWVIAPPSLGTVYENLSQYGTTGVATFLQHGAEAAIRHGESYLRTYRARCREARDIVCAALSEVPRLRFVKPPGTLYLFAQVQGMDDSLAFAKRILQETRVGLAPGSAFGPEGESHIRLCFGLSPALLEQAMEPLVRFLRA